jgi:hypothetical protein
MEGLDGRYAGVGLSGIALIVLIAFAVCLVAYFFLRKRIERKVLLAALCLFLVGFSIALITVLRDRFISGVDAPYYVYQVRHLLEHGGTSEFAPPVVFYTMGGFSVLVGDVTLGVKIGQALFPALMSLTNFMLVRYLTKNNFAALSVALIAVLLGAGLAGTIGAIKNMGAMALTPLFYLFFLKFVNGEGRKWTLKTIKIGGRELSLTLSTTLLISVGLYLMVMATHFLTAGFVFISVVAYMTFYAGYRRKIPWRELKFLGLLGVVISFALLSGTIRGHIVSNSNSFSKSYPVPGDVFPFTTQTGEFPMIGFAPIIALTLPAAWFILRQRDRRGQLLIAALITALLCSQPWVISPNFCFRFGFMIFLSVPALIGISIWAMRRTHPKVASGILAAGVISASVAFVVMTTGLAQMGPSGAMSEEQWNALSGIREQLPENCMICSASRELVPEDSHWQMVLLDRDEVDYLADWEGSPLTIENIAGRLADRQRERHVTYLLLVDANLIENVENLAESGLKDTGIGNAYCRGLELDDSLASLIDLGYQLPDYYVILPTLPESMEGEWIHASLGYYRELHFVGTTPIENLADEIRRRENEFGSPCLAIAEVGYYENENLDELDLVLLTSNDDYGALKVEENSEFGDFSLSGFSDGQEDEEWYEDEGPQPTDEIRFNSNPLFAFILLPIELVQGIYGTTAYGLMKLLVAIPLSIGIMGFLIGLIAIFLRKFKGAR